MDRRRFLVSSAAATAAGLLHDRVQLPRMLSPVGVQLFSVPKLLSENFRSGIGMLSQMGYREVELYGPFPFSDPDAIARWAAVTPQLGFSGSGYFGNTAQQVRAILDENRITVPAAHTDLATLQKRMGALGEAAQAIGFTYVVLPSIPDELRKNLDDYRRMADAFNKIGAEAKRAGLRFAYHNHGYGLHEMDGKVPLRVLLDATDPSLVFLEMDIYWTAAGGADPVELLKAYPDRYRMMHVKDMKQKKTFSGDGGDSRQWIEMFPFMTTAGDGVMNVRAIVEQARKSGVKHFFVEQDMVAEPAVALKRSFDFVSAL